MSTINGWERVLGRRLVGVVFILVTVLGLTACISMNSDLLDLDLEESPVPSIGGLSVMSLETRDLAKEAEAVVFGEVIAVRTVSGLWKGAETIFTDADIRVTECINGSPPEYLTIREPGGKVGNLALRVTHVPHFRPGETVLVFLTSSPYGEEFHDVCGGVKGKLTVEGDRLLEMNISVQELLSRIKRALAGEQVENDPYFIPQNAASTSVPSSLQPSSYAYVEDRWPDPAPRVSYWINARSDVWLSPIQKSAKTWNLGRFRFVYAGTTTRWGGIRDGYNVVEAYFSYGNTGWLARTWIWYHEEGGVWNILECDIETNLYYRWAIGSFPDACDVQNVMTHEFGHWLGLLDLYRVQESEMTMYWIAYPGETKKRSLTSCEKRAVQDIY